MYARARIIILQTCCGGRIFSRRVRAYITRGQLLLCERIDDYRRADTHSQRSSEICFYYYSTPSPSRSRRRSRPLREFPRGRSRFLVRFSFSLGILEEFDNRVGYSKTVSRPKGLLYRRRQVSIEPYYG